MKSSDSDENVWNSGTQRLIKAVRQSCNQFTLMSPAQLVDYSKETDKHANGEYDCD